MADPFVGEIRMFAGNYAPQGWAFCDGSLLSISDNQVLFQLLGTTYGGDGQNTFGLPFLVDRLPLHVGTSSRSGTTYTLGQTGGSENVTLNTNQLPNHQHAFNATSANASQSSPSGGLPASGGANLYVNASSGAAMAPAAIGSTGGNAAHANMMPFLAVSFIISLFGIFPSQS